MLFDNIFKNEIGWSFIRDNCLEILVSPPRGSPEVLVPSSTGAMKEETTKRKIIANMMIIFFLCLSFSNLCLGKKSGKSINKIYTAFGEEAMIIDIAKIIISITETAFLSKIILAIIAIARNTNAVIGGSYEN